MGEPIVMVFSLQNDGEDGLYVLKWFTPLEGLRSDCLKVLKSEERVAYDGPLVKRVRPVIENYILISPGETASAAFNLDEGYAVDTAGEYVVSLDTPSVDIVPAGWDPLQAKIDGFNNNKTEIFALLGAEVTFRVVDLGGEARLTEGQSARREAALVPTMAPSAGPQPPAFEGGNMHQRDIVADAHYLGFQLCIDSLAALGNNPRYRRWFGTYDAGLFVRVRDTFRAIRDTMRTDVFKYRLTGSGCHPGDHAYTHNGSRRITVCSKFWSDPWVGCNSKPGIIVHEHSHATAFTNDRANGCDECRALAIADREASTRNASNFEFYAEGV